MTFKNIKIKMKGGKSRMQRVKVLASGKYKFVKNLTKSRGHARSSNPSPKKKARKVKRKMARRKRRRRGGMTIPLAPVIGLVAGLGPTIKEAMAGNVDAAIHEAAWAYTGYDTYDSTFRLERLQYGLTPLVIGLLVHKFVGGAPLNFNRMLGRAKVPFIRI